MIAMMFFNRALGSESGAKILNMARARKPTTGELPMCELSTSSLEAQ
jgi:hypothetical protein